jgi:hypothetical protein
MERRFASLRRLRASRCCLIGARIKEPNDYRRQYFGIVVGGRRFIYINAEADFDREEGPPPDDVVLDVCDGGTSWGALYDPATGRFSELAFNGVP